MGSVGGKQLTKVKVPQMELHLFNAASVTGRVARRALSLAADTSVASADVVLVPDVPIEIGVAGGSMLVELPAPAGPSDAVAESGVVDVEVGSGNLEECREGEDGGSGELHFDWTSI
jgi:hypothetical protein